MNSDQQQSNQIRTDNSISDMEIASLVTGDIAGDEREDLLRRLIRSPASVEKYRILTELHADAKGPVRSSWIDYRHFGLAAATVLAVATLLAVNSVWLSDPEQSELVAVRGAADAAVVPLDNADLNQLPRRFAWPSQPGADRYRVRLFDEQLGEVWASDWGPMTEISDVDYSEATAGADARRYYWIVEVDGQAPRPELGPFWFTAEE